MKSVTNVKNKYKTALNVEKKKKKKTLVGGGVAMGSEPKSSTTGHGLKAQIVHGEAVSHLMKGLSLLQLHSTVETPLFLPRVALEWP